MSLAQSLKLALKSLAGSKMRAFLTMLGIIIGVASVIILVSLMEGMTRQMTAEFEKMGTNRLSAEVYGMGPSRAFKAGDMDEMFQQNRALLTAMPPKAELSVRVTHGTQAFGATTVSAVSEQFRTVEKLAVAQGRFLAFADMTTRNKVCVVGPYLAAQAFGGKAVGQSVKLNGDQYRIVGVLAPKGNGRKGTPDDTLLVPYTLAPSFGSEASTFAFATVEAAKNTQARQALERALYDFFRSRDAFFIMDPAEIIKSVDKMNGTMTMVRRLR